MYRMLSLIVCASMFFVSHDGLATSESPCPQNVISNSPECIARGVFEGKDSDMPVGGRFAIAILPTHGNNGKAVIPRTIPEALSAMQGMLPHWYRNALRRSHGEGECTVTVDQLSYTGLVTSWFWVHWELDAKNSSLRQQFAKLGVRTGAQVEQAMMLGVCEMTRNDEQSALKAIAALGTAS